MKTVLVLGATGQVGSQVVRILAARGYKVKAIVRKPNTIIHNVNSNVEYCVGDLTEPESLKKHLKNVAVVIATANIAVPVDNITIHQFYNIGYTQFIEMCEHMGVKQFILSSAPVGKIDHKIPELCGKRAIEALLMHSKMQYSIVRNTAFMDMWLVVTGCRQMEYPDPHATTKRSFWLLKFWNKLMGNFVCKYGIMFAPGGAHHGANFICSEDVAEILAGCIENPWAYNRIIENGGSEFVTWRYIADLYAQHLKRKIRIIPFPEILIAFFQNAMLLFSKSASSALSFMRHVASYQVNLDSKEVIEKLQLPKQLTIAEYIGARFKAVHPLNKPEDEHANINLGTQD